MVNTQMAAEEEIDEHDEFEPETRSVGFNLRSGGTDLFRGVLVALIALAVGAFVLAQGYGDDATDSVTDDGSIRTGDLTSVDPDGTLTTDGAEDGDASGDTDDPAAPATDGTLTDGSATGAATGDAATDDAMTDDTMADGTDADTTSDTSDPAASSDTTALGLNDATRPAAEVEVLVLNATDRKGIAGQATELVGQASYKTAAAANASGSMTSTILYMEGYRADAIAVSQVFTDGLEGLVQPYDPDSPPAQEIGTANVIVILGIDDAIPIG